MPTKKILILLNLLFLAGCATNSGYKYQEKESLDNLRGKIISSGKQTFSKLKIEQLNNQVKDSFSYAKGKTSNKFINQSDHQKFFSYKTPKNNLHLVAKFKKTGNCSINWDGQINEENLSIFYEAAAYISNHPCNNVLVKLSSPGGLITPGIKMGLLIKQNQWDTVAWKGEKSQRFNTVCASSCSFAWAAGSRRYAMSANFSAIFNKENVTDAGTIGFHQINRLDANKNKVCLDDPIHPVNLLSYEYFNKMLGPEYGLIFFAKMMDLSCDFFKGETAVVTYWEPKLWDFIYRDKYTKEVFNNYR